MGFRQITETDIPGIIAGAEPLGGYGWDFNSCMRRWEAGHTYLRPDGRCIVIERRRARASDDEGQTTVWTFEDPA